MIGTLCLNILKIVNYNNKLKKHQIKLLKVEFKEPNTGIVGIYPYPSIIITIISLFN